MPDKISLSENICQSYPLLLEHLKAVLAYNKHKNLTSIKSIEAGKVLHIEDSIAVLEELSAAPEGKLVDLGSGAGYPGIPLALVSGRSTVLLESNKKKAAFLQEFIDNAGIEKKVQVFPERSEEHAERCRNAYTVVTARAVAELPVLLELAEPLLAKQGHLVALKGDPGLPELERANSVAEKLGFSFLSRRDFVLSDETSKRCALVYRKEAGTNVLLPRRPGMAAKRPFA